MYPIASGLPFTGIDIAWQLVAAATGISGGLALLRLVPRRRRSRG